MKRSLLIISDGFVFGEMEDAESYGDRGSKTISSVSAGSFFHVKNL